MRAKPKKKAGSRYGLWAVLAVAAAAGPPAVARSEVPANPAPGDGAVFVEKLDPKVPPADRFGNALTSSQRVWRPMCGTAPGAMTAEALAQMAARHKELFGHGGGPQPAGSAFNIVYQFSPETPSVLEGAMQQVAVALESTFGDLLSMTINVDWAPMGSGILGGTGVSRSTMSYESLRDSLQADMDSDDTIQAFLPAGSFVPVRYDESSASVTQETEVSVAWGNIRALGGSTEQTVASMTFNSDFTWDFDPSNGIASGTYDFQSVAAHEIGHAMGFFSEVDSGGDNMSIIDVFRFRNTDGCCNYDPETVEEFGTVPRIVDFNAPNDAHTFDIITVEHRYSDGSPYQASHFREQSPPIGIMDPAMASGQSFFPDYFQDPDVDLFDAIGWDVPGSMVSIPLPFADAFDGIDLDPIKWIGVDGAHGSMRGVGEPSPEWSLNLDSTTPGGDAARSTFLDATSVPSPLVAYFYQHTGTDDPPEAGDDLFVEYLDDSDNWVQLAQHLGGGPSGPFEYVSIPLPASAIHAGFRLRFRATADGTAGADDWFVDDICIGSAKDCPEPPPPPTPCADADDDGIAGINDLLILLAQWGSSVEGPPDFDGSGIVGIEDLLILLADWGPCG